MGRINSFAVRFALLLVAPISLSLAQNVIVLENQNPGTPSSTWDISGAGDSTIQGFATQMSVNKGETVHFKINTPASAYHLDIYRMGYYLGNGARLIAGNILPTAKLPQTQPGPATDSTTGLKDYGTWAESASWAVPANAVSGIYFAKVTRNDTGGASQIVFIVRDDASVSDIVFQTSDATWQAYNDYGSNSLYVGSPVGRAYKVSYNRPFNTRGDSTHDFVFHAEYPMVRWLEANGYNVSYISEIDTDARGTNLVSHKLFMSVGHDEYWSGLQRTNVENARAAGVNLAFFSGNEASWKTRWENSIDGSNTPYRTLVCYKESLADAKIDPTPTWTGYWRDPRFTPPYDADRAENRLIGTISVVNDNGQSYTLQVPSQYSGLRFWRNTSIASLAPGTTGSLAAQTLGYEWDISPDNASRPPGLMDLSATTVSGVPVLQGFGLNYVTGTAVNNTTLYRDPSGALVFGSGTVQWSWGLDATHDDGTSVPSTAMQQATVNLLADMSAQPGSLQAGLVAATASSDHTPPVSTISSPVSGATVPFGASSVISGTANDTGGVVAGVEVSTDAGKTWHRASGTTSWTYTWVPNESGSVTIQTRAVDDSGNIETPSAGVAVTVPSGLSTLWPASSVPGLVDQGPDSAVELGVRFQSDSPGKVTGIRFYKSAANTGTHVGNLWSSNGTLLASVTFSGETASGWQQMNFSSPVSISANTVYIASYHCLNGHYSEDNYYFASDGTDNPPLHAPVDGVDGNNGVYSYGAGSVFPSSTWNSANFWVDVSFQGGPPPALVSIAVTPANPSIVVGGSQPFTATGTYSDNSTQNLTAQVTWTSGTTPVASINSGGVATGLSVGSSTITAALSGVSGSTTLTVKSAPTLVSIAVTPANPTITTGGSQQFTATATYSDSSTSNLTTQATWTSGSTSVASINSSGLATGLSAGSSTITAALSGVSGSTTLNVQAAPLAITTSSLPGGPPNTPYSSTVAATGGTLPYTWSITVGSLPAGLSLNPSTGAITGTPTTAGTSSFTVQVKDSESPAATSTKALSITIAVQVVTIWPSTATPTLVDGGPDSAVELGVKFRSDVAGQINSIRFYKATANTGTHVGNLWSTTGTLLATVTFSGETASGWQQMNFSSPVSVAANTVYVASYHCTAGHYSADQNYFASAGVDNPPLHALANGVSGGDGVYTYGASSVFPSSTWNSANYWVDVVFQAAAPPTLVSMAVTPTNPTVLVGGSQQFTATGTYSDNSTQNLTAQVTWTSGSMSVATINAAGLASGLSAGSSTITAALSGVSGSTTLTVKSPPTLVSIAVTPANPSIVVGASQPFTATGTYSDNSTSNLTAQVTWTSGTTSVVTISSSGLASGLSPGSSAITAALSGVNGGTTLTVQPAPLTITTSSLPNGPPNTPYSATVAASGGTLPYTWSITVGSLPAGLSLNPSTGAITGTPTTAGTSSFTVQVADSSSPVATATKALSITIANPVMTIWPSTATPVLADQGPDNPNELGVKFRSDVAGKINGIRFYKSAANTGTHVGNLWSSSGTLLASVTFTGETASGWQQMNFSSPVTITANTVYVASYHCTIGHYSEDDNFFTNAGVDNPPLHALANGASGPNGVYAYGATSVFPTSAWNSANYWVDVAFQAAVPPTLQSISVTPANPSIFVGGSQQFTATGTYSDGSTQNLTAQVTWTSGSTSVATVGAGGLASGLSAGSSTITATLSGSSGSTTLTVKTPPTLVSIGVTPANPTITTGGSQQFTATGTYSDSSTQNITTQATWTSSSTSVATVNSTGLATGLTAGTATVSASLIGVTGGTVLTVQNAPLTITTTNLPGGLVNAGYSATLAASGGTPPYTWSLNPGPLPPGLSLNAANGAIAGVPTTPGTFNFTVVATDSTSGTPQTAVKALSIGVTSSLTIWPSTAVPKLADAGADSAVELGVKFKADVGGKVTGIRFYKASTNTGTHLGDLWSSTGTKLATATFTGETGSGWQQVNFTNPVAITANTVYVASCHCTKGHYSADASYFATAGVDNPPLHALANSVSGGDGVYAYGASSTFPTSTYNSDNYWVDLVFQPNPPPALNSITVTPASPSIDLWASQQFTATGTYSDGSTSNLTSFASWSSSSTSVATMSSSGLASTVSGGTSTISATFSGVTGSTILTVKVVALSSIAVTPVNTTLSIGVPQQFMAMGTLADGTTQDLTSKVTWTSSQPGIASISTSGLALAASAGTTTISAAFSGISGSTSLTVQALPLVVGSASLSNGTLSGPYSAALSASGGTPPFTWSISSGSLPPGLTVNAASGAIFGSPNASGAYSFTAQVTDSGSPAQMATAPLNINVLGAQTTPILVVTNSANPFTVYFSEILLAEGLNEFNLQDLSSVVSGGLGQYDVAVLGQTTLSPAQVLVLSNWVYAGGKLIAMRPDPQLAGLLGLTPTGTSLSQGYLLANNASVPGAGIVYQPIQFHGTADNYTLNGATPLATLYSSAQSPTINPAVSIMTVGPNNGQAAAFTFDLAQSVVYTRQGNPAWSGEARDGLSPIRPDDLFFGNASFDPEPDWVDLNNVSIPQADEEQRLLANMFIYMDASTRLLPRFWYFPHGYQAVVVMTGDDHAGTYGGSYATTRFDQFLAATLPGTTVADWTAPRCTAYIYTAPVSCLTNDAQAAMYNANGFEIGVHLNTGCADWTPSSLDTFFTSQLGQFTSMFPSLPPQTTHRIHCIAWSDFSDGASISRAHGIRLDTSYYYYPSTWILDRPGMFTGSGIPMRFATAQGNILDIYQAPSQMTDESGQTFPQTCDSLLDDALGPQGYYGAFVANIHTDVEPEPDADDIFASALSRGVPIISSRQLLTWLDARNGSSFQSISWTGTSETFAIQANVNATGLQGMIPVPSGCAVTAVKFNGSPSAYSLALIKGIPYTVFSAATGNYEVDYALPTAPPAVSSALPASGAIGVNPNTAVVVSFNKGIAPATLNAGTFTLTDSLNNPVAGTITYDPNSYTAQFVSSALLGVSKGYTATVVGGPSGVTDLAGHPLASNFAWSFTTLAASSAIWPSTAVPTLTDAGADNPIEVGVKFRSDVAGTITGIRFYKSSANTGLHIAHLWSGTGTLLGSATFTSETASGWQQVNFATPISIAANTVYVASYHVVAGHYSEDDSYFSTVGVDNAPLHALANGISGGNGVYTYGAPAFPNQTYNGANYWVDVVFEPTGQ